MRSPRIISAVVSIALSLLAAPAGALGHRSLVPTVVWNRVMRVHVCEEGNGRGSWHVNGPLYAGGLGWRLATWTAWRRPDFPVSAANATPQQQAWAMQRFVRYAMHGWWPDQVGCTGGY